ncbi:MAG TPA: hypothetical protein VN887_20075 [Candidatus Angelobacter sp.]|nr:hypothetical protein [Candidatus Angelobacter sp.]
MNSINDIKARIDKLDLSQLASLERWIDQREKWKLAELLCL